MFLKLLRYKFNAHRNLFIILSVIALSMSAVGAGALWFLRSGLDHISDGLLLTLISIFSTIFFYGFTGYYLLQSGCLYHCDGHSAICTIL